VKKPNKKRDERVSRREILKLGAGAAVGTQLQGAAKLDQGRKAPVKAAVKVGPKFFTADEYALVDELSEMIIPTDDHSPGARAAKVAEYIDARVAEAFEDETRERWRQGLQLVDRLSREMNGKTFIAAAAPERLAVLTRMAQNETDPKQPEERFFRELKRRVVRGYYSSKIGIHDEMEYKGNTYLREFAGEDAK
jgi:hypothetical protein